MGTYRHMHTSKSRQQNGELTKDDVCPSSSCAVRQVSGFGKELNADIHASRKKT